MDHYKRKVPFNQKDIFSGCPNGWVWKPEFGKCYYIINEDMTWNEANQVCKEVYPNSTEATLTSVESQEENDFILSLLPFYSWIGGTDMAEEGVWR